MGLLALALIPVWAAPVALAGPDEPASAGPHVSREAMVIDLPFRTIYRDSADLAAGTTEVYRPGRSGLMVRTYLVTSRDARHWSRTLLSTQVTVRPLDRVILQGIRPGLGRPAPQPGHRQCGVASWSHRDGAEAAHRALPFGTRVTVRHEQSGRSVTVVINDRGPFIPGRVIDLSDDVFVLLAPLGQGLADVCVTWS